MHISYNSDEEMIIKQVALFFVLTSRLSVNKVFIKLFVPARFL